MYATSLLSSDLFGESSNGRCLKFFYLFDADLGNSCLRLKNMDNRKTSFVLDYCFSCMLELNNLPIFKQENGSYGDSYPVDYSRGKGVQFPFVVTDRVIIKVYWKNFVHFNNTTSGSVHLSYLFSGK